MRQYSTTDYKNWFSQTVSVLGDEKILFSFWCSEHLDMKEDFLERFTVLFNTFAEKMEVDALPSTDYALREENENNTFEEI